MKLAPLRYFFSKAGYLFAFTIILNWQSAAIADSNCTHAELAGLKWLDNMSRSQREQDYTGIFTHEYGAKMHSLSIDHRVRDGVEYEQLMNLDGELHKVVRNAHPLSCVHPGHRLVRFGSQLNAEPDGCGLSSVYHINITGQERVAGRNAIQLSLIPRDQYRHGYQLALDEQSALLLKSQVLTQNGQVLERFQFTQLTLNPVDDSGEQDHAGYQAKHSQVHSEEGSGVVEPIWEVQWVPPGFTSTANSSPTSHTYTDGLAVFSVMLQLAPAAKLEQGEGKARQGATIAYTKTMDIDAKSYLITVVGEVPLETAQRVASSVAM